MALGGVAEQDLYDRVIEAAAALAIRYRELPFGVTPSYELDVLDLAVRRAGADRGRIYDQVDAAHRACEPGQVVVRLDGLHRWIVVEADDFGRYGEACGWLWEPRPVPESCSEMLAQAAACMVGMGFGPVLERVR